MRIPRDRAAEHRADQQVVLPPREAVAGVEDHTDGAIDGGPCVVPELAPRGIERHTDGAAMSPSYIFPLCTRPCPRRDCRAPRFSPACLAARNNRALLSDSHQ